jgi:hypothetical protein
MKLISIYIAFYLVIILMVRQKKIVLSPINLIFISAIGGLIVLLGSSPIIIEVLEGKKSINNDL